MKSNWWHRWKLLIWWIWPCHIWWICINGLYITLENWWWIKMDTLQWWVCFFYVNIGLIFIFCKNELLLIENVTKSWIYWHLFFWHWWNDMILWYPSMSGILFLSFSLFCPVPPFFHNDPVFGFKFFYQKKKLPSNQFITCIFKNIREADI